jgi:predicted nucleic acid-binding protein
VTGFLLDTNVLSEFARTGEPDQHVDRWLKTTAEESVFASVLTFAEIRRGIELLPPGKRRTQLEQWQDDLVASFEMRLFPVTKAIADRWAVLAAQAQRKGITLANIDGLIAATALEHDLTLVTRNVTDFAGVEVQLFNPWDS